MIAFLPVSDTSVATLDIEDLASALEYSSVWAASNGGYVRANKWKKKVVYLHRLIMRAKEGESVDHINGNPLDNRRNNLRIATHQQNMSNKGVQINSKTKVKGVFATTNSPRWRAQVRVNYKTLHLGCFDTKLEAAEAYNQAALFHFGEFAKLNNLKEL